MRGSETACIGGELIVGRVARQPIHLSATDIQDLAAFLGALTGPVVQAK